jgi:hypothetical protein
MSKMSVAKWEIVVLHEVTTGVEEVVHLLHARDLGVGRTASGPRTRGRTQRL